MPTVPVPPKKAAIVPNGLTPSVTANPTFSVPLLTLITVIVVPLNDATPENLLVSNPSPSVSPAPNLSALNVANTPDT